MLAMFRCTKTSPGCKPRTVVSGIRESEQPIQRICGRWPDARVGKREGWSEAIFCAHWRFWWRARLKWSADSDRVSLHAFNCYGHCNWYGWLTLCR